MRTTMTREGQRIEITLTTDGNLNVVTVGARRHMYRHQQTAVSMYRTVLREHIRAGWKMEIGGTV